MKKLLLIWLTILTLFFLVNPTVRLAIAKEGDACDPTLGTNSCGVGFTCVEKDPRKVPRAPTDGSCVPSIGIDRPTQGFSTIGDAVSKGLTVVFAVAVLIVLVMLILGAFEWITSGGDKEAVGKARNRIINALIGLAVLAIAFALANVAARFTGLSLFNITIPSPNPDASGL